MSLMDKIVKIKKLQKAANSAMMIIPELWIREMGWNRETLFEMEISLGKREITIREKK